MRGPIALTVAVALATLALAGPAGAAPQPRAAASEAEQALERALSLFTPAHARAVAGAERPAGRDATLVLRDLAVRLDDLAPGDRVLAERILSRPTDSRDALKPYRAPARRVCDATTCFWWVTRTADAPSLADRNRNRVPDWVDTTRATFRTVWRAEVGRYGYARPLRDTRGAQGRHRGKLDVYVADLGAFGIYGYCTSDDPRRSVSRSISAYCAVDDDFSSRQFRGTTGVRALRVTAAHEFFHAVQFAYDAHEDPWLMEGSATWIEDEVYPSIDDNVQYLRTSPLARDDFYFPLDHHDPDHSHDAAGLTYGAWIWWRFLSERFGRGVVRDVWSRARGSAYAIQATEAALAARSAPLGSVFADFGAANAAPASHYRDGARYAAQPGVGPAPRLTRLGAGFMTTGAVQVPMPHLSTDLYAFAPASGLSPASKLTVSVQLASGSGTRSASLLLRRTNGTLERLAIPVDAAGAGTLDGVDFGVGQLASATLVLSNGGARFGNCGSDLRPPFYSCRGTALDDGTFTFVATASQ